MSPRRRGRAAAESLVRAALAAVEPAGTVARALSLEGDTLRVAGGSTEYSARRVWIVGAGKAGAGMARAALDLLNGRVLGGTVAVPRGVHTELPGLTVWNAGHPVPDVHSMAAAADALAVARRAGPDDLIVCVLSGGASAMWAAPPPGVALGELQTLTSALLRSGATIDEINTVRRNVSCIAGGRLAAAATAPILTLAISDVSGAAPHAIGSGPTVPDPTTGDDAIEVLARREIPISPSIRRHLRLEAGGAQTARTVDADFHVIASVRDALAAAAEEAARLGYEPTVVSDNLAGEAREAGREVVRALVRAGDDPSRPHALLWGGETTVTVRGPGRGGRNQELALAAALALDGTSDPVVAAVGTDGVDGPTPAAGAIVDGGTAERGRAAGLDPAESLARNDSHSFLHAAGDLLVTGPTGTNVGDLVVALGGEPG